VAGRLTLLTARPGRSVVLEGARAAGAAVPGLLQNRLLVGRIFHLAAHKPASVAQLATLMLTDNSNYTITTGLARNVSEQTRRIRAMKQEWATRITRKRERLRATSARLQRGPTPDADSHTTPTLDDDLARPPLTPGIRHTPAVIYSPPANYQDMTIADLKQRLRRRKALDRYGPLTLRQGAIRLMKQLDEQDQDTTEQEHAHRSRRATARARAWLADGDTPPGHQRNLLTWRQYEADHAAAMLDMHREQRAAATADPTPAPEPEPTQGHANWDQWWDPDLDIMYPEPATD
jgi:hypothetical protein